MNKCIIWIKREIQIYFLKTIFTYGGKMFAKREVINKKSTTGIKLTTAIAISWLRMLLQVRRKRCYFSRNLRQ